MRLVTKYSDSDIEENGSYFPIDEAKRLIDEVKPLLIGQYITGIFVNGITDAKANPNESYCDYEMRLNKAEIDKGKPRWQQTSHALYDTVKLVINKQEIEFTLFACFAYYINFNVRSNCCFYTRTSDQVNLKPVGEKEIKKELISSNKWIDITSLYSKYIVGPGITSPKIKDIRVNQINEDGEELLDSIDFLLDNGRVLRIFREVFDWTGIKVE